MGKKKCLSRSEFLEKLKLRAPQEIDVPGIGIVKMQRLSNAKMAQIHMEDLTPIEKSLATIIEACTDLTDKDIGALQEADATAFAALASAVNGFLSNLGGDPGKKH